MFSRRGTKGMTSPLQLLCSNYMKTNHETSRRFDSNGQNDLRPSMQERATVGPQGIWWEGWFLNEKVKSEQELAMHKCGVCNQPCQVKCKPSILWHFVEAKNGLRVQESTLCCSAHSLLFWLWQSSQKSRNSWTLRIPPCAGARNRAGQHLGTYFLGFSSFLMLLDTFSSIWEELYIFSWLLVVKFLRLETSVCSHINWWDFEGKNVNLISLFRRKFRHLFLRKLLAWVWSSDIILCVGVELLSSKTITSYKTKKLRIEENYLNEFNNKLCS